MEVLPLPAGAVIRNLGGEAGSASHAEREASSFLRPPNGTGNSGDPK